MTGTQQTVERSTGVGELNVAPLLEMRDLSARIVQEVADDGTALDAAISLATRVAGLSPAAVVATRQLIAVATTHEFDRHLAAESRAFSALWGTPTFRRAVAAYARVADG